ncbi:MAG: Fe-S cluster assembly protein SufD [Frankiaceae bacterium]|nr:Fe-S cluster assembly protein SufD [Frankiaceae bacterium]
MTDFAIPTGREEAWRFTPTRRLRGLFEPLADGGDGKIVVDIDTPAGVTVEHVDPREDARVGSVFTPTERIAALAFEGTKQAIVVSVPAEARPDKPVSLVVRGEGGPSYGHITLDIGAFAEATVVIDHIGTTTFASNLEVKVGDGARLTVVSLQDWDDDAVHLEHQVAYVGRDATYRSVVVTLGGDLVRINPIVRFTGPGGDAELLGLFFADDGQHLEHRLLIDHDQPHCKSRVTYKGALQGEKAHTVWIGDVIIRANAIGTDTYELNRNLVLTDGARADSVPNLEIETGEVTGAGHASATGRFDDEQLFYLMSRGIDEAVARRLVVRGFFADIVERIGLPEIEQRLMNAVDDELANVERALARSTS